MKRLAVIAAVLLTGCGTASGEGTKISDPTWTLTTDPYGREHACLYVDGEYAATIYCVPAP